VFEDAGEFLHAFLETSASAVLGLMLSFTIGTLLAVLLSVSVFLRRAIYPYAIFFQTVPIIAIAPLLVIWFGFGQPTVIASAFIVSIFPVIASTLLGLQSTDPAFDDLFRLYSASRLDHLLKLRIPFALPHVFSGLRIASGLAVIGAIVGEFIGGGGLGAVVDAARTQQRVDKVFAAVLISSALGLLLVALVNFLSWLALRRWHASAQAR
jgi:NitT/TauT family transport system permease protein